jgi:chromosomal replication initiator protein
MNYLVIPGVKPGVLIHNGQNFILSAVLDHFSLKYEDIKKKSRERKIVMPRQICMWLMRKHASMTLKQIGELFNLDHTTVIHSVTTINNLMDVDKEVQNIIRSIYSKL